MEIWGFFLLGFGLVAGFALLLWFLIKNRRAGETPLLLIQQQLDALRGDFVKTLETSRLGIDTRLDNAAKVFLGLESRMVKVEEAARQVLEVGKDIASLQQILRAPKLRGNFGEQLLGDLLAQMMPQENYLLQHTFRNGERVDAVIKTAQGLVPVDAKFPLENFQRLMGVNSEEEKKSARRQFLIDVRKHIDDIASKYILPAEGTFEFALMYIPAENVYYEIITKDLNAGEEKSLVAHALRKKVIPVSPNTFYAYLQTILLGLRGMQVEKRVDEIMAEMGRLRKDMSLFRTDFSVLGKHLNNSVTCFEKSDKRLSRLEDRLAGLEVIPKILKEDPERLSSPTNGDPGVLADPGG